MHVPVYPAVTATIEPLKPALQVQRGGVPLELSGHTVKTAVAASSVAANGSMAVGGGMRGVKCR